MSETSAAQSNSELADRGREPGTAPLSAGDVAELFGLGKDELAVLTGTHVNTLCIHPESQRMQDGLRKLMRLFSAALAIQPDATRAVYLIKNVPIAEFNHQTLMNLVEQGRSRDAVDYLESLEAGFIG